MDIPPYKMPLAEKGVPQMRNRLTGLFIGFFVLLYPISALDQNSGSISAEARIRYKILEIQKIKRFPGITVALISPDGQLISLAEGYSDLEAKIRMESKDRMLTGSVGKTFVASLVFQLAEEGKLRLDDPIEKFLGRESWFAELPNGKDITVRLLLSHRTGIIQHWFESERFQTAYLEHISQNPDYVCSPREAISFVLNTKPLFPAGKDFHYSDMNYILIGLIIENITGHNYYDELKNRILFRFGLSDTIPAMSRKLPGLIPGYISPKSSFGVASSKSIRDGLLLANPGSEWTGGGLVSSSSDLARWAKILFEAKAFSRPYLEEMEKDYGSYYGLGVEKWSTEIGPLLGHTGYYPGYNTAIGYFPNCRVAVAIQINRDYGNSPLQNILVDLTKAFIESPANAK